jgi:UDP-N-acetylglucosamine--N-acetylmuramyl-(pentapeptide) pyrophosphoryl-undecaprenol N-acetylglucosamine transferase
MNSRAAPLILLAAGGTGGHLFPAEALARALADHGVTVDLATDERATRYGSAFPARATHIIRSETIRSRNPFSIAKSALVLAGGVASAYALIGRLKPAAIVGFGGYPSIPAVLAGSLRGVPTIIHEQNAVMGRANRFLARRAAVIATSLPGVLDRDPMLARKATLTGNPVRPNVLVAGNAAYASPAEASFKLVVFGGSQGARIMAEIVPPAIERLDHALRARLRLVQQARDEDAPAVRATYARLGVAAEVMAFFTDLPARLSRAHLVIGRAGASTVAELAVLGRPAILVPLPHALDQDQLANATTLADAGGAIVIRQSDFTPERLAQEIETLAATPGRLSTMAANARRIGMPDAAQRLAELVLRTANVIPASAN